MALTTEQIEHIVRLRAKLTKLSNELSKVKISDVILQPTNNNIIVDINNQIASYVDHVGMTREQYISIVQPLKDQRTTLIQQNEVIHQENNGLKQVAQQQYENDKIIIQSQIDINETELLTTIKNTDLIKLQ